jgi:hypothetical protein
LLETARKYLTASKISSKTQVVHLENTIEQFGSTVVTTRTIKDIATKVNCKGAEMLNEADNQKETSKFNNIR